MSKQIYEETQEFLEDKWGPLGGWAQAVMFAADLKPVTTPKKTTSTTSTPKASPITSLDSVVKAEWDSPASTGAYAEEPSPLKRKAQVVEFKRTRSATRLNLKRTESDLIADDVDKLKVDPGLDGDVK
jgi:N-glycosylase/DNA lyase